MRRGMAAWGAVLTAVVVAATGLLAAPSPAGAKRSPTYYVSLGDSYAVGYQPGKGATPGYTTYVARHTGLTLANFGCSGAKTTSLLNAVGCPDTLPNTAGVITYPTTTQIAAATAFIAAHKGHIGLVTVTIGGNDVLPCAKVPTPVGCVGTAVTTIKTEVTSIALQLRAAAGPKVPIIGSTYPDVILGLYVFPTNPAPQALVNLANLSVVGFKALVNPALAQSYATSSVAFVDVTKAAGAYTSLKRTVHTTAYGTIPVSVAGVCKFSWFCQKGDVHPTNAGYTLIGKLIVAKYHAIRRR